MVNAPVPEYQSENAIQGRGKGVARRGKGVRGKGVRGKGGEEKVSYIKFLTRSPAAR
jgi:hypothetical protein